MRRRGLAFATTAGRTGPVGWVVQSQQRSGRVKEAWAGGKRCFERWVHARHGSQAARQRARLGWALWAVGGGRACAGFEKLSRRPGAHPALLASGPARLRAGRAWDHHLLSHHTITATIESCLHREPAAVAPLSTLPILGCVPGCPLLARRGAAR